MQVSMHNWMRAEPVEVTIRRLAKYGYDSIEISYDSVALGPDAPGIKAVRQMLKDLEGQVMSIVPSEVGKVKAMASPEEEWEWAIAGLKAVHDHATRAGI